MRNFKSKACCDCGREYVPGSSTAKWCEGCRVIAQRETKRKWREANPEKTRESDRKYREANPEKKRESGRKWREANLEKDRENSRKWYEANPEKAFENSRKWREANLEKDRENSRKGREAKRNYQISILERMFNNGELHGAIDRAAERGMASPDSGVSLNGHGEGEVLDRDESRGG